eukprot:scaffold36758_cov54-Phaeocystis_antarctica.AAC.4
MRTSHSSHRRAVPRTVAPQVNTGIHMLNDATLVQRTHAFARRFAAMPSSTTVVWRTTVPGHDNCARATRPLETSYSPRTDGPYGWHHVQRQNGLVAAILRRAAPRVRLLDAFALSNARADRHVVSKTKQMVTENGTRVTTAIDDCLHYCLPSAVDTWNVLLAKALLEGPATETAD